MTRTLHGLCKSQKRSVQSIEPLMMRVSSKRRQVTASWWPCSVFTQSPLNVHTWQQYTTTSPGGSTPCMNSYYPEVVWCSGNDVGRINNVTLCWAPLILGRVVVVFGWLYYLGINQPPRPTQPGHRSVSRPMSTGDGVATARGKKQWVTHSSKPCYQDCWHTDLVIKGTCCKLSRPSGRRRSYAGIIGSNNPRWLKRLT